MIEIECHSSVIEYLMKNLRRNQLNIFKYSKQITVSSTTHKLKNAEKMLFFKIITMIAA